MQRKRCTLLADLREWCDRTAGVAGFVGVSGDEMVSQRGGRCRRTGGSSATVLRSPCQIHLRFGGVNGKLLLTFVSGGRPQEFESPRLGTWGFTQRGWRRAGSRRRGCYVIADWTQSTPDSHCCVPFLAKFNDKAPLIIYLALTGLFPALFLARS